jgi:hypothetical protein
MSRSDANLPKHETRFILRGSNAAAFDFKKHTWVPHLANVFVFVAEAGYH